jgi:hypothetical protein
MRSPDRTPPGRSTRCVRVSAVCEPVRVSASDTCGNAIATSSPVSLCPARRPGPAPRGAQRREIEDPSAPRHPCRIERQRNAAAIRLRKRALRGWSGAAAWRLVSCCRQPGAGPAEDDPGRRFERDRPHFRNTRQAVDVPKRAPAAHDLTWSDPVARPRGARGFDVADVGDQGGELPPGNFALAQVWMPAELGVVEFGSPDRHRLLQAGVEESDRALPSRGTPPSRRRQRPQTFKPAATLVGVGARKPGPFGRCRPSRSNALTGKYHATPRCPLLRTTVTRRACSRQATKRKARTTGPRRSHRC